MVPFLSYIIRPQVAYGGGVPLGKSLIHCKISRGGVLQLWAKISICNMLQISKRYTNMFLGSFELDHEPWGSDES
jgi:hypothetical protein